MRASYGSSLIECLVALAVFSMGTGCHATWLAHSLGVHARASRSFAATTLAVTFAERLEAHGKSHCAKAASSATGQFGCAGRGRMADDMRAFQGGIERHLGPRGEGRIDCHEASDCVIRIFWNGREELAWPLRPGV